MKVAFISHSYHEKTRSPDFFVDFLRRYGADVVKFSDESWIDGGFSIADEVLAQYFDLIVVWQMEYTAQAIVLKSPSTRLLFIPMFDGCHDLGLDYWSDFKGKARILCFCRALHERLRRWGIGSVYAQYFPNPVEYDVIDDYSSLRGFFWQRTGTITWNEIRDLLGDTQWSEMHIHAHLDPECSEFIWPPQEDVDKYGVAISDWFEDKKDFDVLVQRSNIYFAPRVLEGIGMSFLEGMARGQCVVGSGYPTMSEYITDGVSGILYDPKDLQPLDFSSVGRLGKKARSNIERGYEDWLRDCDTRLATFVFDEDLGSRFDAMEDYGAWSCCDRRLRKVVKRKPDPSLANAMQGGCRMGGIERADLPDKPLVTAAIVTFNCEDTFEDTLDSITDQTYGNLEVVVIDGASNDTTLDLIRKNDHRIDCWLCEPDDGPYDAMNKAAVHARGHWIIFINAGDRFYTPTAVEDALRDAPADAEFIIGHHIYLTTEGRRELHKANNFEQTWSRLVKGDLSSYWLTGVPGHQATFTRPELIREHKYDLGLRIAADHDFMYRMRSRGANFHHSDTIVAVYEAGGYSFQNQNSCAKEWWRIARKFGVRRKVDRFFRKNYSPKIDLNPGLRVMRRIPFGIAARKTAEASAFASKAVRGRIWQSLLQKDIRPNITNMSQLCVVTPTFNSVKFIDDTILGVVSQRGEFLLRYHIQDGGSTDGTLDKLEKWRQRISGRWNGWARDNFPKMNNGVIFTYASEPDNGMYDAINKGFQAIQPTNDDIMTWVNSDDVPSQGSFEFVRRRFLDFPEIAFMGGRCTEIDEDGAFLWSSRVIPMPQVTLQAGLHDGRHLVFLIQEGTCWRGWLWHKVGGLRSDVRYAGDFDLWRRFARYAEFVIVDLSLCERRVHREQLSQNMGAYYEEIDQIILTEGEKENAKRVFEDQFLKWSRPFAGYNRPPEFFAPFLRYNRGQSQPWELGRFSYLCHQNTSIFVTSYGSQFSHPGRPSGSYDPINQGALELHLPDGYWVIDQAESHIFIDVPKPGRYTVFLTVRSDFDNQGCELRHNGTSLLNVALPVSGQDRDIKLCFDAQLESQSNRIDIHLSPIEGEDPPRLVVLSCEAINSEKTGGKGKKKDIHVMPHPGGGWATRREGAKRVSDRHKTQRAAVAAACARANRERVAVVVHGCNGTVRKSAG